MFSYLLKRILIFLPTLLAITVISFVISQNAPGDPVEMMLSGGSDNGELSDKTTGEKAYLEKRKELHLDLPVFYVALASFAETDTLYKIPKKREQEMLKRLLYESGNWEVIQKYYIQLNKTESVIYKVPKDSIQAENILMLKSKIVELKEIKQPADIPAHITNINRLAIQLANPGVLSEIKQLEISFQEIYSQSQLWKTWIPWFHFYGFNNQYHIWLSKLVRFDFGISYTDKRPITSKLPEAIRWSLLINLISILISYLVSVPIGVYSATHRNTAKERTLTAFLFVLYSLPGFWVATMLILFFGGGDYLAWFPSNGVQDTMHNENWSIGKRLADWAYHLILPNFCYTYSSFAFLSRQMRVGMLEVMGQDFIRTARAKGLSESVVTWKHAFRNSLIPIITLFASVFPAMIGGSVILETIFTIPGMGFLSYQAIIARDYPVMIAVFTISGILTLTGILVADLLYAVVDPRITFSKK